MALGAIAGYFGGWAEVVITRLVDIMLAFPVVLLGLAAAAIFSPSVLTTIVVIAATQWMYMARVVYSMVQTLKEWEFVAAARAVGVGDWRIVVAPHRAAPGAGGDRLRHAGRGHQHPAGGHAELPQRRGAAADGELGLDDLRRA